MSIDPDSFFKAARSLRLSAEEKAGIKNNLGFSVTKAGDQRLGMAMNQQNFIENAQKLSLRPDEKARIRESIMASMRTHHRSFNPFHGLFRLAASMTAALLLFVSAGAGISWAAEEALPGDLLYPVKVRVTEPLMLRMHSSTEERVRMRVHFAKRRLEEVEQLAETAKLTPENTAIAKQHLAEQSEALQSELSALSEENTPVSNDIVIDATAELQAHETVLAMIAEHNHDTPLQDLIRETKKVRAFAEDMSVHTSRNDMHEIADKQAHEELEKARQSEGNDDALVTQAISDAENDLRAARNTGASLEERTEKTVSALRKAKEANLMLRMPSHRTLKFGTDLERRHDDDQNDEHVSDEQIPALSSSSSSFEDKNNTSSSSEAPRLSSSNPSTKKEGRSHEDREHDSKFIEIKFHDRNSSLGSSTASSVPDHEDEKLDIEHDEEGAEHL